MADYRKKIRDLLALAESPNEHEARSALLTARKLMVKYKISETEVVNIEKQEVVKELTGITYSIRRDPWISDLAFIIAEHHCCKWYQSKEKKKQTSEIGLIGLTDDAAICKDVFIYAVDCIRQKTEKLRKTQGVRVANGYGYGFAAGLLKAYNEQQKNDEENWALVMVTPEVVSNETKKMSKAKINDGKKFQESDNRAYIKGMDDGKKFHEQKRIKEDNKRMKCSDLKPNDKVVFKVDVYHDSHEQTFNGTVIGVYPGRHTVDVCYLEGYHTRNDFIPYEKMLAKYDSNGEEMSFDNIRGKSVLLKPE